MRFTLTAHLSPPLPATLRPATPPEYRPPRYDTRGAEVRSQRDAVIASLLRCPERVGRAGDARAAHRRVLPPGHTAGA